MSSAVVEGTNASPFHSGEQEMQLLAGKRETIENMSHRTIRSFMPDQHREFFEKLPFIVVGAVDEKGWPWASLLTGSPGFIQSPNPTTLEIELFRSKDDPVHKFIKAKSPLGFLGIEMHTRRRNRVNGRVAQLEQSCMTITVDQSYGNCPQYIQHRDVKFVRDPGVPPEDTVEVTHFSNLDETAQTLIGKADTFFVSSYIQPKHNPVIEGVDVSHRGGRPGFIKVEGNQLTIPEFPGNNYFNTLGNFLMNPKAGLVFVNFSTGDLLMLTGTVELLWEDNKNVTAFKGAERAWRFTLDHGLCQKGALPFRSTLGEFSPNSLLTDTWREAEERENAEEKRQLWQKFRITKIVDESSVIRSFYLEPANGNPILPFKAGQFLTIRVKPEKNKKTIVRNYTVSSAPSDPTYRISVKREESGIVSRYLHDVLKVGDIIEAKAPKGNFYINAAEKRPAVLIAGGVGITPMISMARHVAIEGLRTRHLRELTIFHSAQTTKQQAFAKSFKELEQGTNGKIRYYSIIERPASGEKAGVNFNGTGFITADTFRQTLVLDDYDFFLCGPPPFMQAVYDVLISLGVQDARIFAEAFGPASLKRTNDNRVSVTDIKEEAEVAIVKFRKFGFDQRWNKGDATLLELAEKYGLNPDYGCRNGSCGTCITKIKSGSVSYRTKPSANHTSDEVLICCAVPAKGTDILEIEL